MVLLIQKKKNDIKEELRRKINIGLWGANTEGYKLTFIESSRERWSILKIIYAFLLGICQKYFIVCLLRTK